MLELARTLGFQEGAHPGETDDRSLRFVSLDLQPPSRA
jgi:acetyltransferase